jgi:hypothetical protein
VQGFIKQYADGMFDPEVMSILEDAFDDAWRRVQAGKAPSAPMNMLPRVARSARDTNPSGQSGRT